MIIEKQEDVTRAVLEEMHRTPDARTHEILSALVEHLHDRQAHSVRGSPFGVQIRRRARFSS